MDDDSYIIFRDLDWTKRGRLYCQVVTYALNDQVLSNTKCEIQTALLVLKWLLTLQDETEGPLPAGTTQCCLSGLVWTVTG